MTPRRAGIKDVAGRAGVGISTVSRVFSGSAEVKAELRARVLDAAAELGYEPHFLAQSLRRGATRSAGFIVDDLSNHLNIDIATGAEGALRAEHYSLLVMNSEMDARLDPLNIRVLAARRVDALMMAPVTEDDPELVETVRTLEVPVVIVEGDLPGVESASFVVSDHRSGSAAALRHLISVGHRRITLITGSADFRSSRERRHAIDDVAREAPSGTRLDHVATDLTTAGGRAAAADVLARRDPPSAIIVGGDRLLTGVLGSIEASGLELGADLSLVASDPVELARVFRPPIAAIRRDALGVGRRAAELLLARLEDPAMPPQRILLPTVFEPLGSVAPPPSGRPSNGRGAARAR